MANLEKSQGPSKKDTVPASTENTVAKTTPFPKSGEFTQKVKEDFSTEQLHKIEDAIDATGSLPSAMQEKIIDTLLEKAGVPLGEFIYSSTLRRRVVEYAKTIDGSIRRYEAAATKKDREAALKDIISRIETYTEQLMLQFTEDNCSKTVAESYFSKMQERIRDTYKIGIVTAQLKIAELLSAEDTEGAVAEAKKYMRESIFGLGPDVHPDDITLQPMIDQMAANLVTQVAERVLPVLIDKILAFASEGGFASAWGSAKNFGSFMKDWVRTPFHDESFDRMHTALVPVAELGVGGAASSMGPIFKSIAATACNVSLSNGQMMQLLSSVSGVLIFNGAMILGTMGIGLGVKSAHLTGRAAQIAGVTTAALSALSTGARMGNSTIGTLHKITTGHLSFSALEEKLHQKVMTNKQ